MDSRKLPIRSFVRLDKPQLQSVIDRLRELGYRTIGPQIADGAIVYDDVDRVEQIPVGWLDEQDGGKYRLRKDGGAYFDYVVGPHSLKNYIFPPRETVLTAKRTEGQWQFQSPDCRPISPESAADFGAIRLQDRPLAVIGVRSCDLHALRVQDRVFLEGQYVDPAYKARREGLFVVAVHCRRAAATCFCHSMKTGPAATFGFDLAIAELDEYFVIEVGTERGGEAIAATPWSPCSADDVQRAREQPAQLAREMKAGSRSLDTTDIRDLLLDNLNHARWHDVAQRCLACANCTMVCPTCFCSSIEEVSDLSGDNVRRERSWASCFTAEHSYMNSGTVRKTTESRYRQWLTHKLATWHDQFGTSGCIGCGRCITWCPVGIDLTEEVAAIRETQ